MLKVNSKREGLAEI